MGFFGWDKETFKKFCFKHWQQVLPEQTGVGTTTFMQNDDGASVVLIRMPALKLTPEWLGLFQHEVIHATFDVLSAVGQTKIDTSGPNEYVTYLAQQISTVLLAEGLKK